MIDRCVVVAIDGPAPGHARAALAAELARHWSSVNVDVAHAARPTPALPLRLGVDTVLALQYVTATISSQIADARGRGVLLVDDLPARVLSDVRAGLPPDQQDHPLLRSLADLVERWHPYDLVLQLPRRTPPSAQPSLLAETVMDHGRAVMHLHVPTAEPAAAAAWINGRREVVALVYGTRPRLHPTLPIARAGEEPGTPSPATD